MDEKDKSGTMGQPADPFDDLLTLEDTLYTSAYQQGTQDGARAGRIEGRIFGLEKGFDKFAALSALHGRAVVWGARLPPRQGTETTRKPVEEEARGHSNTTLPTIASNSRLAKHIDTLHALTDPRTFSPLNTEEAVVDYDDRFKRATAKTKLIERSIGEAGLQSADALPASPSGAKRQGMKPKRDGKKGEDSIEDFSGLPVLR